MNLHLFKNKKAEMLKGYRKKNVAMVLLTIATVSCSSQSHHVEEDSGSVRFDVGLDAISDLTVDSTLDLAPIDAVSDLGDCQNVFCREIELSDSTAPFELPARFYKDIKYGERPRNTFDLFLPSGDEPASVVVYFHGGGFLGGDKAAIYTESGFQNIINRFVTNNVAFASFNYSFIDDAEGVMKSLMDSKRGLQFLRFHSKQFNIKSDNIVLIGSSAGAGTSLWLGLNDDLAKIDSTDPILRESTRVKAVVALSTQSSYDILDWHHSTFSEYQPQGMNRDVVLSLVGEERVTEFYGVQKLSELNTPRVVEARAKLDMLALLTSDDPEIFLSSGAVEYKFPATQSQILHHPLHAKALMDKAASVGVQSRVDLPQLNIDTTQGEDLAAFVLRKLK